MPRKRKSEPLHLLRKRDDSPPAGRETNYGLDKLPTGLHSCVVSSVLARALLQHTQLTSLAGLQLDQDR